MTLMEQVLGPGRSSSGKCLITRSVLGAARQLSVQDFPGRMFSVDAT